MNRDEPPSLFNREPNLPAAEAARDGAIAQTTQRISAYTAARRAARVVAQGQHHFTSETVRRWLALHDPDGAIAVQKEPRVLGAAMTELARKRLAFPTTHYRVEGAIANHARPQRLWQSLSCEVP